MAKPRKPLERVRKICLGFAETTEKEAEKMFAMFVNNHPNDGRVALWLNAADGVQEMLVDADPERFFVPP